jgi:hypothetical protein
LLLSFHRIIGVPLIDLHDQAIHWYMRQGRKTEEDVRRGLQDTGIEIPPRNRAVLRLLFEGPHTIEGFTK